MPQRLPNFRDYDDASRKNPFGWDYGHGKDRKRETFKTQTAKNKFRRNFERKWFADRDALVSFDAGRWREYEALAERVGGIAALRDAVNMYVDKGGSASITFAEAAKAKLEDLERIESVNLKRVPLYCGRFEAFAGNKDMAHYTDAEVQAWIDSLVKEKHSFNSLSNHLKTVRSVFNRAIDKGLIRDSPARHVTLPSKRGEKRTELLDPVQVERLLHHIWKLNKGWAAVYGLLFFTGLRVSMVAPHPDKRARGEFIRADMINVKAKEIVIPAGITKTQDALIIDEGLAPANLWAWLKYIKDAKIPEPSQTFNKRRAKLCKDASGDGVQIKWPENVHRRSCASYYAAIFGKDRTSDLLGNTSGMVAKHYKVATFRKLADDYFKILPPKDSAK